ncbi:hypothetical protein [Helicobacter canis]|uniref:hypothetical protein n=1 Tax=Helicobacter canis TaxID=29419 RepID=UPI0003FD6F49|nr:hypothetical protein [Helicobacter canis]
MGEQCGSVADFVKGTTTKVANLPQNPQSSHSPTAIPRILEEENRANQSSLRVDLSTKQSNSAQAESIQSMVARLRATLKASPLAWGQKEWKKRGGSKGGRACQFKPPLSPLDRTLSQTSLESSHTAKKVDSSVDCSQ